MSGAVAEGQRLGTSPRAGEGRDTAPAGQHGAACGGREGDGPQQLSPGLGAGTGPSQRGQGRWNQGFPPPGPHGLQTRALPISDI